MAKMLYDRMSNRVTNTLIVLFAFLPLAALVGAGYIAVHFIMKFW